MLVAFGLALIGILAPGTARAGTATLIDGKVSYIAAPGESNRVQVIFVPGEGIHVIDRNNSVTAGQGCISINTDAAFCERRLQESNLSLIRVRLRGRNDRVRIIAEARLVHLLGGAGADVLQGHGRKSVLDGSRGGDILTGGSGNDSLQGGAGNDRLFGQHGRDVLRGQNGRDVLGAHDGGRDVIAGGSGFDQARVDVGLDQVTSVERFF